MASTRRPACCSPTRRVWPSITARLPWAPRSMACRLSAAGAPASAPAGCRSAGGWVGSTAACATPRVSHRLRSTLLDTDPSRLAAQGEEFQADLRAPRAGFADAVIEAVPVQLPAAGLHGLQVLQQVEIAAFQLQHQAVTVEHGNRCGGRAVAG